MAPSLSRNNSQNILFLACFMWCIWAPALQAEIAAAIASGLETQNRKMKSPVSATDAVKRQFGIVFGFLENSSLCFSVCFTVSVSGTWTRGFKLILYVSFIMCLQYSFCEWASILSFWTFPLICKFTESFRLKTQHMKICKFLWLKLQLASDGQHRR